jgi:transcriptional regulator with GAF, ATPase, and Fis domain/Tfp pilus assembly protein PilF
MNRIGQLDTVLIEGAESEPEIFPISPHASILQHVKQRISRGEFDEAALAIEEAEASAVLGDGRHPGLLSYLKCLLHYKKGAYESAIEEGEIACRLLGDTGEIGLQGETRRLTAKSRLALGLLEQAVIDFEEAVLLFRRAGEVELMLAAFNDLAHVYFIQGKWVLAKELLERGEREASRHEKRSLVYSFTMNLGTLAFTRGNLMEAKSHFDRCAEMLGDEEGRRTCRLSIMKANLSLLTENAELAREQFRKALTIATREGSRREIALALEGLAEVEMEKGELIEAERSIEAALSIATSIAPQGDLVNEILRRKGDILLRQGRIKEAEEALERSLAISKHLGDRLEDAAARGLLGEIAARSGKREAALGCFASADSHFSELAEKWEKARMHYRAAVALRQAFGTGLVGKECLRFLESAREIFAKLGLVRARALAEIETGWLLLELGENDRAAEFATSADLALHSGGREEERLQARRLIEAIEETLTRRSLQRSRELISSDIAFTVTVDEEEAQRRSATCLELLAKKCGLDGAFLIDLDTDGRPVFTAAREIDEPLAFSLLGAVLSRGRGRREPLIVSLRTTEDPRYGSVADLAGRGVTSFLILSAPKQRGVTRHLYLERRDPAKGHLSERDMVLIETMAKDLVYQGSFPEGHKGEEATKGAHWIDLDSDYRGIITRSHQLRGVLRVVEKVRDSSIPVLLEGETGTGKELIAKALHERSKRKEKKFFAVNCAALPENLLESELFGHRRGAFTGAVRDKVGLFEVADGGTFFLDEIADMGQGVQVKLLRFLEEGEFMRLGDVDVRRVDVRVVSATNKDLNEEVEEGRFRKDLFYRLNGIRIMIPPLRERKEDIPPLVEWYLEKYGREEGKRVRGVKREAIQMLLSFDWPGNVRELVNEMRRAMTLVEEDGWIGPAHLSDRLQDRFGAGPPWTGQGKKGDPEGRRPGGLTDVMAGIERQKIVDALKATGGVKLRAARSLGLHEATLRGKMKKYRIGTSEWEI